MNLINKGMRQGLILPLSLLLLFSIGFAMVPHADANGATATMSALPSAPWVYFGETFTVDIVIDADEIAAAQCWILFDPTLVEVVSVVNGDIFPMLQAYTIDNTNGTIKNIWGWTVPAHTGGGTLATVTFLAKEKVGTADITISPADSFVPPYDPITIVDGQVDIRNYPVYVDMTPDYQLVGTEPAYVDINIDPNGNGLSLVDITIGFDATLFEVTDVIDGGLFPVFNVVTLDNTGGVVRMLAFQAPPTPPGILNSGVLATLEITPKQTGVTEVMFDEMAILDVAGNHLYIEEGQNVLVDADIDPPEVTIDSIVPSMQVGNITYIGVPLTVTSTIFDDHLEEVMFFAIDNDTGQFLFSFVYNYEESTELPPTLHVFTWDSIYDLTNGIMTEETITAWYMTGVHGDMFLIFGLYNATGGEPEMGMMAMFDPITHEFMAIHPGPVDFTLGVSTFRPQNLFIDPMGGSPLFVNTSTVFVINENFALVPITPSEKEYDLMVRATDTLDNENGSGLTVFLDFTPPTSYIEFNPAAPNGAGGWYTGTVNFTLTADDGDGSGVATIYYKINDGAWTEYTGPVELTTDGIHTIYYYAVDNAGNEETHKQAAIKIDNTPPTVYHELNPAAANGNNGWYIGNVIVTLFAGDSPSGVDVTKYRINNGAWTTYTGAFTVSSSGIYDIDYFTLDKVGHNTSGSASFNIDKNAPSAVVTLSGTLENGKYTTDVTVHITGTDTGGSGLYSVKYSLDGGAWQTVLGTTYSFLVSSEATHTVTCYAVDNAGNSGSQQQTSFEIQKNQKPTANFSFTPATPTDMQTVTFVDQSADADGTIVSWAWDFGDGSTSTQENPTHRYTNNGTYVIKLTVKDDKNASATVQKAITVTNVAPTALFSFDPEKPKKNQEIEFTSLSTDEDGTIASVAWNFGDGNTSTQTNTTHTYEKKGTYTVTLTVTDNDGATHQRSIDIKVTEETVDIMLYLVLIIVLIIIAIVVLVIWQQRNKKGKQS